MPKRDEVAHYTTIALMIGVPWREARRIAKEIVAEKRGKRRPADKENPA